MTTLSARALTPAARDWLAQTTTARVLSAFERAVNLINPAGDLLTLVTHERALAPFAMWVPVAHFELNGDERVEAAADLLCVGPWRFKVAEAALWDPRPNWAAARWALAEDERWLTLAALSREIGKPGSLLELYEPDAADTPLLRRARSGAQAVCQGLQTRAPEMAQSGARALAGLGGGLTPAGDDFIVGALLAAWGGRHGAGAETLAGPLAEAAAPLTTTLSAAYLRAAARGECLAAWHQLLAALIGRGPGHAVDAQFAEALRPPLRELLSVGHTSGADALAGFLAVHHFRFKEAVP